MKFGSPDDMNLDDLNFNLPPDHELSLIHKKLSEDFMLYVGCAKWGREEWKGLVYPEDSSEKDFLLLYKDYFNAVELNATFYNIKKSNIISWSEKVLGSHFLFCPKFPRRISHLKRLNDVEDLTDYFIQMCQKFGDNLGTTFLQMPENYTPKYFDRLENYMRSLPVDFPVFVELRHEGWYLDKTVFNKTVEMLQTLKKGLIITDTALRRDVIHQCLTIPDVMVRFNGYGLHKTDYERLDQWVARLKDWKQKGLGKVYFFMHQPDELNTPKTCAYFIQKANEVLGTTLHIPI